MEANLAAMMVVVAVVVELRVVRGRADEGAAEDAAEAAQLLQQLRLTSRQLPERTCLAMLRSPHVEEHECSSHV